MKFVTKIKSVVYQISGYTVMEKQVPVISVTAVSAVRSYEVHNIYAFRYGGMEVWRYGGKAIFILSLDISNRTSLERKVLYQ